MHPLLAQAVALPGDPFPLEDPAGNRVEVVIDGGGTRYDLFLARADDVGRRESPPPRDEHPSPRQELPAAEESRPRDEPHASAWRFPGASERPVALPDDVPFIARVSSVVVRDAESLEVTWPDPGPGPVWPGGGVDPGGWGLPNLPPGLAAAAPGAGTPAGNEPGGGGRSGAGGEMDGTDASGALARALADGAEAIVRASVEEGWEVGTDEELPEPFPGRAVRMERDDLERTLSLSTGPGVPWLVLLESPAHRRGSSG